MRERFDRIRRNSTVYQQIIAVFIIVFIGFVVYLGCAVSHVLYQIIAQQTYDGIRSALQTSQLTFASRIQQATATVVGIAEDEGLYACLRDPVKSQAERILRLNEIDDIMMRYANVIMNTDARISVVGRDDVLYSNRQMQTEAVREALLDDLDRYLERVEKGQTSTRTIDWRQRPDVDDAEKMMVSLTLPIMDEEEILGVVTLMLSENELQGMLPVLNSDAHTVFLIDGEKTILACTIPENTGRSFSEIADVNFPVTLTGSISPGDGSERLITYQHLQKFGWTIVDVMDTEAITREVGRVFRTLLVGVVVSVVILLVLGLVLAKSITRPLACLTGQMLQLVHEDANTPRSRDPQVRNEVTLLQSGFSIMRSKLDSLIAENVRVEREKRETEIRALQSQIRPHFLFNTLNSVRMAILNRNSEKAAEMIYELSGLLRMTIVKGDELVTLQEEIAGVMHYVHIIQLRHGMNFVVETKIDPELINLRVPNLLLQPLVENSIVHGFEYLKEPGRIRITANEEDGFTVLRILDNGCGFCDKADFSATRSGQRMSGIGMENVEQRMKLYFGEKSCMKIKRLENTWTTVELWLPHREE